MLIAWRPNSRSWAAPAVDANVHVANTTVVIAVLSSFCMSSSRRSAQRPRCAASKGASPVRVGTSGLLGGLLRRLYIRNRTKFTAFITCECATRWRVQQRHDVWTVVGYGVHVIDRV